MAALVVIGRIVRLRATGRRRPRRRGWRRCRARRAARTSSAPTKWSRAGRRSSRPSRGTDRWTFGAGQSVFAESPDRVYVVQRGELPEIPRPMTKQAVGPRSEHRVPDRPAAVARCDHRQPSGQRRQRAAGRGRHGGVGEDQQDGRRRPLGALRPGVRRPGQPAARDGQLDAVGREPAAAALHRHQPLRCGQERVARRRSQARDLQVLARRQDQAA